MLPALGGGLFGARAASDSMGIKLGIWSDRFENVRCAVMLLASRQVNLKFKAENQTAKSAAGGPGNTMHYYSRNSIDTTIACAGLHSKRCMHPTACKYVCSSCDNTRLLSIQVTSCHWPFKFACDCPELLEALNHSHHHPRNATTIKLMHTCWSRVPCP